MKQRTIELINGEIDGTNSARDSEELRSCLAGDREASELYSELAEMSVLLGRVEPVEPPPGLRQAILRETVFKPERPRQSFLQWLFGNPESMAPLAWRFASVLAAGVFLGVIVGQLLPTTPMGTSEATGTMAPPPNPSGRSEWTVDAEGVAGALELTRSDSRVFLGFDLATQGAARMVLRLDPDALGFAGLTRESGEIDSFEVLPDRVVLSVRGDQRYTMVLDRRRSMETELFLTLSIADSPVWDRVVRLPEME